MSELGGLLEGGIVGLAVAEAASTVVEPALEPSRQEANSKVRARIHELPELAQAVAQALLSYDDVLEDVHRNGYPEDALRVQIQLALRAPGVSEAIAVYRRNKLNGKNLELSRAQLHHAYAKAQLEYQWWPFLDSLAASPTDIAVLANAIQRGLVRAPFALPYQLPGEGGRIPRFPQSDLDAEAHAAAAGYTLDQLFIETGLAGNPPGPEALYRAKFRGAINDADVTQGLIEGRARAEWAPAFEADAIQIPTAHDFVEKRLRGWTDDQGMYAGTARHGMSQDDTETLFLISGRPISAHQIFVGILRGGVYDGPTDHIDDAWLKGAKESNIRPEWYNLLWAGRYSFPPLFQLNNLVKAGAVPPETAAQWATWEGQAPEVVQVLTTYWQAVYPTGATAAAVKPDPAVTAARSSAATKIRKAYIGGSISELAARQNLADLGLAGPAIDKVIADANIEIEVETQAGNTAGGTPH